MARTRRGKINELLLEQSVNQKPVANGGDDFDLCVKLFFDELDIRNLAYHTKRWHKENLHCVKLALDKLNLPIKPIEIKKSHIRSCILYWKNDCNLSPTTINHRIASLKQLYIFLIAEGMVNHNPVDTINNLKSPKTIIKPFNEQQLKDLLKQPDKTTFVGYRDYTMMLVLLDTGVRLIEILNMKIDDVNLKQNKILVFGKGSKEREVIFQATTKEILRKYLLVRGELDHDYLWVSQDSNPLKRKSFQDRLTHYGRQANITGVRVSPHTFRHTCAKLYLTNGGDIISLQKLLGHSSLDMVRHYVNLWGSDLQQMHRKYSPVEKLFGGI